MITPTIHFIRPYWLFGFIPGLLYLAWVMYSRQQNNPWKNVCDPHLLPALLQGGPSKPRLFFNITLFLFFSICMLALAGPSWNKTQLPVYRDVNSTMLVLDLSPAMLQDDIKPNRLSRAKFKIRDLINASKNTQMGLVVFTDEPFVASPLSQDANTLSVMLDELDPQMMPISGGDMGQGLGQGVTLLQQAATHGNLLLITASEPNASSWDVAKNIALAGNHLNILAMLEPGPNTQATIAKLRQLAATGNGSLYQFTPDSSDIQSILSGNQARQTIKDDKVENAYLWQDAGPWFCLLLLPFALLVLREKARHEKHH